jgi:hypothetical protein
LSELAGLGAILLRTSLGDAVAAIQQIEQQTRKPASLATSF